jgi:hypothetical protein
MNPRFLLPFDDEDMFRLELDAIKKAGTLDLPPSTPLHTYKGNGGRTTAYCFGFTLKDW